MIEVSKTAIEANKRRKAFEKKISDQAQKLIKEPPLPAIVERIVPVIPPPTTHMGLVDEHDFSEYRAWAAMKDFEESPRIKKRKEVGYDKPPGIYTIWDAVHLSAIYYGFSAEDVAGPVRRANLVVARFCACWISKNLLGYSYPIIGRVLNGRDHTSILHGTRKFDHMIECGDERAVWVFRLHIRGEPPNGQSESHICDNQLKADGHSAEAS